MQTNTTDDIFPRQLRKLLDYLDTTPARFSKECNFTSNNIVKSYLEGKYRPTMKSIEKILARYPVRPEWLLFERGEMWEVDYFQERYLKFKDQGGDTAKEKVTNLIDIFETNGASMAHRLGVNKHTINKIMNDKIKTLTPEKINRFVESVPFIKDYFE